MKKLVIATALLAVVLGLGLFALSKTIYDVRASFDLRGHPVVGGTAPNQIVIVSDYKCPNCKQFDEEVLPQLLPLAERGVVTVGFVDKPVLARRMKLPQDDSLLASVAAQCVFEKFGIGPYLLLRQDLYRMQGPETEVWVTNALLNRSFRRAGLPYTLQNCPNQAAIRRMIEEDIRRIDAQQVVGTPAVFVNGQRVRNNFESVERALRQN